MSKLFKGSIDYIFWHESISWALGCGNINIYYKVGPGGHNQMPALKRRRNTPRWPTYSFWLGQKKMAYPGLPEVDEKQCMEKRERRRVKVIVNKSQIHLQTPPWVANTNCLDQLFKVTKKICGLSRQLA